MTYLSPAFEAAVRPQQKTRIESMGTDRVSMTPNAEILTPLQVVVLNERPSICAPCGGRCCKNAPGIAHPDEFGAPHHALMRLRIRRALLSGSWAVDWWEGDPRPYGTYDHQRSGLDRVSDVPWLRPARSTALGQLRDPFWGGTDGTCSWLSYTAGCRAAFEQRPYQCRALAPKADLECHMPAGANKDDMAMAWLPYRELVWSVLERLEEDTDVPQTTH